MDQSKKRHWVHSHLFHIAIKMILISKAIRLMIAASQASALIFSEYIGFWGG